MDARQIPLSLSPRIFPFFPGKGTPLPVTWGKLRGRDVGKMWDEVVPWKMKNVGNYKKNGFKKKTSSRLPRFRGSRILEDNSRGLGEGCASLNAVKSHHGSALENGIQPVPPGGLGSADSMGFASGWSGS